MSNKDDGGKAFPRTAVRDENSGMSLRDYFAAKAIPGLIDARRPFAAGGPAGSVHVSPAMVAKEAYAMADAMLAERAK